MLDNKIFNETWHELYIECLADPFDRRTDIKFCDEYKVPMATFNRCKRKYRKDIFAEVDKRRKEYVREARARGYKSLMGKLDKDTNALKLLFQLMGDLVERQESKVEYMSHEDKLRRVNALLESISEKKSIREEGRGNQGERRASDAKGNDASISEASQSVPEKDGPNADVPSRVDRNV